MPIPVSPSAPPPPPPPPPTRGRCTTCGRDYQLNADGGVRAHDPLPVAHCPGSGYPPA